MNLSPGSYALVAFLFGFDKVWKNFKVVNALIGVSITLTNIMGYFSRDTDAWLIHRKRFCFRKSWLKVATMASFQIVVSKIQQDDRNTCCYMLVAVHKRWLKSLGWLSRFVLQLTLFLCILSNVKNQKNRNKGYYEDNERWWFFAFERDPWREYKLYRSNVQTLNPDLFKVLAVSYGLSTGFPKEPGFRNPYKTEETRLIRYFCDKGFIDTRFFKR